MFKVIMAGVVLPFFLAVGALMLGMWLALTSVEVVKIEQPPKPTRVMECRQFYDQGKNKEWAECMGVPYR
jgi:crotonobetainyl-CoA:carnitine CoA-transferase CaiB-like acyl-CoA transferase